MVFGMAERYIENCNRTLTQIKSILCNNKNKHQVIEPKLKQKLIPRERFVVQLDHLPSIDRMSSTSTRPDSIHLKMQTISTHVNFQ